MNNKVRCAFCNTYMYQFTVSRKYFVKNNHMPQAC